MMVPMIGRKGRKIVPRIAPAIAPTSEATIAVFEPFAFAAPAVATVFQRAASGATKPIGDSDFSLEEGAAAVARMESRDACGKILITPS